MTSEQDKDSEVTVIRIVQYKGSADAVRSALAKSLPLGVKYVVGYTLTVAEHSSNLPPAIELDASEVNDVIGGVHCTGHVDYAHTMFGDIRHCCFCSSAECEGGCQNETNR